MTLALDAVPLAEGRECVVLVLPSLGLDVADLWGPAAALLDGRVKMLGVDLPGHGASTPTRGPLRIEDLASAALDAVAQDSGVPLVVAGVSIGGLLAQAAAVQRPDLVSGLLLCNTLPRISTASDWNTRAATVAAHGLASQVDGARARWWGSALRAGDPATVQRLSERVADRDPESYLGLYAALGAFDGWSALPALGLPTQLVAGAEDGPTPPDAMRQMVGSMPDARIDVLDGVGHQAPVEAPERVAGALLDLIRRMDRHDQAGE